MEDADSDADTDPYFFIITDIQYSNINESENKV